MYRLEEELIKIRSKLDSIDSAIRDVTGCVVVFVIIFSISSVAFFFMFLLGG